jgi:hypothetical protein
MFDIHQYEFFVEYVLNQWVALLMYSIRHVFYKKLFLRKNEDDLEGENTFCLANE